MENNDKLKNIVKSKIAISKFKDENIAMKNNNKYFSKIAVVACVCIIFTSGIVFAKDIEKIITNLFSNTSPAIEKATCKGYVQTNLDNFVYDKDIGVKVDNIVLDELSLNISIKFESKNKEIQKIRFNKFVILTDTGEKIFDNNQQYITSLEGVYTAKSINWQNDVEKIDNNVFADSILFTLSERSKDKKELIFKIESLDVTYQDGSKEELYGNWNFNIKITDKMINTQNVNYIWRGNDEHLENCSAILTPTGLKVEYNLKEKFDIEKASTEREQLTEKEWLGSTFFFLKHNDKFYEAIQFSPDNYECTRFILNYDNMSSLEDNPEQLELYLQPFDLTIFLEKDK